MYCRLGTRQADKNNYLNNLLWNGDNLVGQVLIV